MTNRLTDEEYEQVIDALAERAFLSALSIFREQIHDWIPKHAMEKIMWQNEKPIVNSITFSLNQVQGDALVEIEKIRRRNQ